MPYTSYRSMSRADTDAIYAYLMAQKPAAAGEPVGRTAFPFNLRLRCMFVWNFLFLEDTLPDASKGASADWTRGRYLASALGHCAECHTPRGIFGQLERRARLQGAALGRVAAPDITPQGLGGAWLDRADCRRSSQRESAARVLRSARCIRWSC